MSRYVSQPHPHRAQAQTNPARTQIFNASHMVGFDVPNVAHDMILRFMGVNFTAITDGSARIPSAVGDDTKPVPAILDDTPAAPPASTKTPEQDKAMWEGPLPVPPRPYPHSGSCP